MQLESLKPALDPRTNISKFVFKKLSKYGQKELYIMMSKLKISNSQSKNVRNSDTAGQLQHSVHKVHYTEQKQRTSGDNDDRRTPPPDKK